MKIAGGVRMDAVLGPPSSTEALSLRGIVPHARSLSATQVIHRAFRMAILLFVARRLGAEVLGMYALLLTLVEMVATISGCGYTDFLTRHIAQEPRSARTIVQRTTELRLACIVPSLVIALLLLAVLRFPKGLLVNTALLSITLVPRAISEALQGVLKGMRRFAPLPWIAFAYGAIVLGLAVVLVQRGFGLRGVIAAEIFGAILGAVLLRFSTARYLNIIASKGPNLRSLFGLVFAFNIYPFLTNLYDRVDVVLLSKIAGSVATGIYSFPYRILAALQIVPYGIMGALLPVLSASDTKHSGADLCARTMKLLLLASFLIILVAFTGAAAIIHWLLGPVYEGSILTLEILIWVSIPAFLNFALNTFLIAAHRENVFLRTTLVCVVFNIVANLLLIPRYSYVGAAAVTIGTECLLLVQNLVIVRRLIGRVILPRDGLMVTGSFLGAMAVLWGLSHAISQLYAGLLASLMFLALVLRNAGGWGGSLGVLREQTLS